MASSVTDDSDVAVDLAVGARVDERAGEWFQGRLLRDGSIIVALILDIFIVSIWFTGPQFMWDASSYYGLDLGRLYDTAATALDAPQGFRYSPAVAQLLVPIGLLPWPLFVALVIGANVAALFAMGRGRWWALLLIPPVLMELWTGNIHILMAAAIYFGFRQPALWAFLLLTKVSPGIGVLWFAIRHEWKNLAIVTAATSAVIGVSLTLAPHLWQEWIAALRSMSTLPTVGDLGVSTLLPRLIIAILVLWFAARRNARWALPLVCLLALPSVWPISWALLAGSLALVFDRRRAESSGPVTKT